MKIQKDGIRKTFTSSTNGLKGKHIAEAAANEWLKKGTAGSAGYALLGGGKPFADMKSRVTGIARRKLSTAFFRAF